MLGINAFRVKKETFDDTIQGPATLNVQLVGIGSETEDVASNTIASTQPAAKMPNVIEVPINPNHQPTLLWKKIRKVRLRQS